MSDQELTQAEEERVSLSSQIEDIRKEISTTSRRITHLGGLITDVLVVTPLEKIAELIMQEGSLEDLVLIVNGAIHSFMEAYPDNPDFNTDEAKFIKNLMRLITMLGEDETGGVFAADSKYYLAMCFEYCKLLPKIPQEGLEFRRQMFEALTFAITEPERVPDLIKMKSEFHEAVGNVISTDDDPGMLKDAMEIIEKVIPQLEDEKTMGEVWAKMGEMDIHTKLMTNANEELRTKAMTLADFVAETINKMNMPVQTGD